MKKKIFLFALIILAVIVAYQLLPIQKWLQSTIDAFHGLGLWGSGLYIGTYVVLSLMLIPGSALTIGAGVIYGFWVGYLIVATASLLTVACAFFLSKTLLRSRMEKWADGNPRFKLLNEAISTKGAVIAFLIRLSPVFPFSITNYLFGLTRVRFWPYMLASWLGMAPGTFLYIYIGMLGKELNGQSQESDSMKTVFLIVGLLATLIVTVIITRLARKALDHQNSAIVSEK